MTCAAFGRHACDTSTWTYDGNGNMTATTDADGNTTDDTYDADDNQTQVTDPLGMSPRRLRRR